MTTKRFVLSTVGISALLNALDSTEGAWRQKFNQATNAARLPDEVTAKAQELAQRVIARLRAGNVAANRLLSAELNGVYGLYHDKFPAAGSGDIHYLVATDTALGKLAAEIICDFLRSQGLTADVYIPAALSTADPLTFSSGMKQLIRWCEETIPGYRSAGYHVVFAVSNIGVPSLAWREVFASLGAVCVGGTAMTRLVVLAKTRPFEPDVVVEKPS